MILASQLRLPVTEIYQVETVSLADLLREHGAPEVIDFLSVDTEGSEYQILQAFPFDKYRFGFICVEHHTVVEAERMKALFEAAGYMQVLEAISGHDGFYVPRAKAALL